MYSLPAWCLSVPRGTIYRQTRHQVLSDAVLHPERFAGDAQLVFLLDQRRRGRREGQHRFDDRPGADVTVDRGAQGAASSLLHQGDRHLDFDVSRVRLLVAHRVRAR